MQLYCIPYLNSLEMIKTISNKHKTKLSRTAIIDLILIKILLKQRKPDYNKLFVLISGNKYNKSIK